MMKLLTDQKHLRISIVTPNYNGSATIRQTLDSVLNQNYPNLEYIVIDGASTDDSQQIIEEYKTQLSIYVSEPDEGHASAVNKGFLYSTGEIMGWINSDDILLPGSLTAIDAIFQARPEIDWITGRPTAIDESGSKLEILPIKKWSRLRFLSGDYRWIQQESTFWRRPLWNRAGDRIDTSLSLANDFELWLRFFRHAELFTLDRTLGSFRRRKGQRSIVFKNEYESEALSVLKNEFESIDEKFRKFYKAILPEEVRSLSKTEVAGRETQLSVADPEVLTLNTSTEIENIPPHILYSRRTPSTSISVITPSFNQVSFVDRCIDSVESQTVQPIEHLIFDPGSMDGSREAISRRNSVTLIAEQDEGQADAVAKGFARAQGEIIAWLNSDDEYAMPNVFSAVIDRFTQPDRPQIVYGRAVYIDEVGRPLRSVYINSDPSEFPEKLYTSVGISQPATFIHRSVIDKIGFPNKSLHFAMDYDFWLRAAHAGLRFAYLDKILAKSRYYSTNKTAGQRKQSYQEICDVLRTNIGYVPDAWLHRFADFLSNGNDGILKNTPPAKRSVLHEKHFRQLKQLYEER